MTQKNEVAEINKDTKVAITPVNEFKVQLQKQYTNQITNFFGGDEQKKMKFLSSLMYSVQKVPELLKCDRSTLINAAMSCAEFQLYPNSVSGEAYILPYSGNAQFQLGYQGVVTLLYRAGAKSIHSDVVYKNDKFKYTSGITQKLIHEPNIFEARGEPVAVYAVVTLHSGEKLIKVMSKEDVMKYREFSKSKDSSYSPWNEKNDPDLMMWKKTAVKQVAKFMPKNDEISKAFERDNEDSRISEAKSMVGASGLEMGNFLKQNEEGDEGKVIQIEEPAIEVGT